MKLLQTIDWFVFSAVVAIVSAAILLILLRSFLKYIDVNPFTWSAITVKRLTDPVVLTIRGMLVSMHIDPIVAPVVAIVLFILIGFFVLQISTGLLNMIGGIALAVGSRSENWQVAIIGYILYALIGLYELMVFARIIGMWFSVGYANRSMRFLIRMTEPLLAPLRRWIRPVGRFDVSPIVAFIILWLLQTVVAGTLLRGWTTRSF